MNKLNNLLSLFFTKSRKVNNEPINKVSLIVIIIIDIFILINVFSGLYYVSQWHLNSSQSHPCFSSWESYRQSNEIDKNYQIIKNSLALENNLKQTYEESQKERLGKVSPFCFDYANAIAKLNQPKNQEILTQIGQKESQINSLNNINTNIRNQYDSSLLEKIAGQPRDLSINQVEAEKVKQELNQNNDSIAKLEQEITQLKNQLLNKSESIEFLVFLNSPQFTQLEKSYQNASFWYPTIQFIFQFLFLLPLILIALFIHRWAQKNGYGLIALMSWHLLVIFFIPLLIKIFEFLQVGIIFQFLFEFISFIFGGLLFLINYLYIFIIPLIGFGLIKFFQKVIFNPQSQISKRVEKSRCLRCAKKIQPNNLYCPHCGYGQYKECNHCHNLSYKSMPYCSYCGVESDRKK